jgi:hypothetical protein
MKAQARERLVSDVERLLRWFREGTLLRPSADIANVIDLSAAISDVCGAPTRPLASGAQTSIRQHIGDAEHVVFVLVDGFGRNLLDRLPQDSFFRRHLAMDLRTVFPSSTAPCLTSIATGLWPATHGVPGWFMYLSGPQRSILTLPFVERGTAKDAGTIGVGAADVFTVEPQPARFRRSTQWVMPKQLVGSVFTTYSCGGAEQTPYSTLELAVERIKHIVEDATAPTYTYWYVPDVDYVEHVRGASHADVAKTLILVERAVEALSEGLRDRAKFIVTADHGQIDIPDEERHLLTPEDSLLHHLIAPPSCEPRAPAFHVRPGAHDAFAAEFRTRFGRTWALLSIDEVDELRLFGPEQLSALTRERLGDCLALNATHELIMAVPRQSREPLRGSHGGLLPDEMLVPLIIV